MKITKRILLHSHTESFNLGLSENNQRSFCLTRLKYIEHRLVALSKNEFLTQDVAVDFKQTASNHPEGI